MTTNFIQKIRELASSKVHINNHEKVNQILNDLIQGGTKRLQVVSDFDRTITKQHENGKTHISSFGMFSLCPSVTPEYRETEHQLTSKYFPLEIDVTIPAAEKRKLMEDWWDLTEIALKGLKVSQEEIFDTAVKLAPSLRDGTRELFEILSKANIPVLVFSAGLGDAVVAVLNHFDVLLPNVKVVSNFLKRDTNEIIQGFNGTIIHLLNKNETALEGTDYYKLIESRDNIIVMGDSLGDAGMAEGVRHANAVLKIGFLYGNVDVNLCAFLDAFDIVLEDDQTMDVVLGILKEIC